jgi:hypothetical protein
MKPIGNIGKHHRNITSPEFFQSEATIDSTLDRAPRAPGVACLAWCRYVWASPAAERSGSVGHVNRILSWDMQFILPCLGNVILAQLTLILICWKMLGKEFMLTWSEHPTLLLTNMTYLLETAIWHHHVMSRVAFCVSFPGGIGSEVGWLESFNTNLGLNTEIHWNYYVTP